MKSLSNHKVIIILVGVAVAIIVACSYWFGVEEKLALNGFNIVESLKPLPVDVSKYSPEQIIF